MRKRLCLGSTFLVQWFFFGVLVYTIADGGALSWRLIGTGLLIFIPFIAVSALVFRAVYTRHHMRGQWWMPTLLVSMGMLVMAMTPYIRPQAPMGVRVAMALSLLVLVNIPLFVAAYYEQQRENEPG